jgi:hypothetical protein
MLPSHPCPHANCITLNELMEKCWPLLVSLVKLRGADAIARKKWQICHRSNQLTINHNHITITQAERSHDGCTKHSPSAPRVFKLYSGSRPKPSYRVDPLGSPPYWAIHRENPTRLPQWPPSDTKGVNCVKVKIYLHKYRSYFGSRHSDG